jgi:hypothetical protein
MPIITSTIKFTTSTKTTSIWNCTTLIGHYAVVSAVVFLKNGDLASADSRGKMFI